MTFSLDQVYLLGDFYKLNKTPSDGTCWENLQEAFFDVGCYFILIGRFYILPIFLHATSSPPWLLRALKAYTSFELYPGYFWLLYFCKAFPSHFYHERYSFERAFFTHRCFLPRTFSPHCGTFCDSDAGRNTPSRTLLCACPTPPVDARSWTTHIVDTRPLVF